MIKNKELVDAHLAQIKECADEASIRLRQLVALRAGQDVGWQVSVAIARLDAISGEVEMIQSMAD